MPMDENIKTGDVLLFEKNWRKNYNIPPTEDPQSFQMTVPVDTVTEQN